MKLKDKIKQKMIIRTNFNNKCKECKATPLIYDETHGDLFCAKCGLIQNDLLTPPKRINNNSSKKTRFKPKGTHFNNLNLWTSKHY